MIVTGYTLGYIGEQLIVLKSVNASFVFMMILGVLMMIAYTYQVMKLRKSLSCFNDKRFKREV